MTTKAASELDRMESFALGAAREKFGPSPAQRKNLLGEILSVAAASAPRAGLDQLAEAPSVGNGPASGGGLHALPPPAMPSSAPTVPVATLNPKAPSPPPVRVAKGGAGLLGVASRAVPLKVLAGALGGMLVGLAVGSTDWGAVGERESLHEGAAASEASPMPSLPPARVKVTESSEPDREAERSSTKAAEVLAGEVAADPAQPARPSVGPARGALATPPEAGRLGAAAADAAEHAETTGSPFYQELTFLRRAQAALRRGDAAYALGLMVSLEQLHKDGALRSEREMTKVLAFCQLGREEEATTLARKLLRRDPQLPYAQRLQGSCADVSVLQAGESSSSLEVSEEREASSEGESSLGQ